MHLENLVNVKFPNTLINLGDISYCSNLESIDLSNTQLQTIGDNALNSNKKLSTLILPSTLNKIGRCVFMGCDSLENINYNGTKAQWNNIEKDSLWNYEASTIKTISCSDGVISLYEKTYTFEKYGLIKSDGSKIAWEQLVDEGLLVIEDESIIKEVDTSLSGDLIVKDTITSIKIDALYGCNNIKGVDLSNTQILRLENNTLNGAYLNLESVKLPDTINYIEGSVFMNCNRLKSIEYNGTMEQWENIEKGLSLDNVHKWCFCTNISTVKCSDGTINIPYSDTSL